jgi:hypothetical protein
MRMRLTGMIRAGWMALYAGAIGLAIGCGGDGEEERSDPAGGGSGTPTDCGGRMCGADSFCDYPDGMCGMGQAGSCAVKPQDCDPEEPQCQPTGPVCGCDGTSYSSDLNAYGAGTDVSTGMNCN